MHALFFTKKYGEIGYCIKVAVRKVRDILFDYDPGTQYLRVSVATSLFTGNLAYGVWGGAQGEGEVEDQSRGQRVRG